jgi:hypothetical protein
MNRLAERIVMRCGQRLEPDVCTDQSDGCQPIGHVGFLGRGKARCRTRTPRLWVVPVDQRLDEFHDPLLARDGRVEPAAHLGEPAINLLEPAINLLEPSVDESPQIDEVLSQRVETRGRVATKIANLGSDLADVAVGRTGKHPGCCGVLFDCLEASSDFTEIILTHSGKATAEAGTAVALRLDAWGYPNGWAYGPH